MLNIFLGIYRTVSYASETPYKQDTCLSVFIVFGEVAEDSVSKPCKKKRVSRSFNRQNTYFFDLTLSANEIPPVFNFLLLKRPTNVLAVVDY